MEQLNKIATDLLDIMKTDKFVEESSDCTAIDEMLKDPEFAVKLTIYLGLFRSSGITLEHTIGHLIFMAYRCGREAANTNKDVQELTKLFNTEANKH